MSSGTDVSYSEWNGRNPQRATEVSGFAYGVRIRGLLPERYQHYLWPCNADQSEPALALDVDHQFVHELPEVDETWVERRTDSQPDSRISLFRQSQGVGLKIECQGRGIFRITSSRVHIEWLPGGTDSAHYFFSYALPLWLECRGVTVLHASAVSYADRVVAFVGRSGAGKSTMCEALVRLGAEFVADDGLAVSEDPLHEWQCYPGPPLFRLWPSALMQQTGVRVEDLEKVHEGFEKRLLPVDRHDEGKCLQSLRFDTVYVLEPQIDGNAEISAIPCSGGDSLIRLIEFSLAHAPGTALGWEAARLRRLGRLAEKAGVKVLTYPYGIDKLGAISEKILEALGK